MANSAGIRSVVRGLGACLPAQCVTNKQLESRVDTSDDWIVQRTGIRQRYLAGEGETTSSLGTAAARAALADAGLGPQDVDLIIVATSTPDLTFPSTATMIQAALGVHQGVAFDIQAVCSGFVFAVATADKFLRSGSHKCALVIGAETFSRILDWTDRTTCVLFGDGAGAIVLAAEPGAPMLHQRGVLTSHLRSDGRHRGKLYVDGQQVQSWNSDVKPEASSESLFTVGADYDAGTIVDTPFNGWIAEVAVYNRPLTQTRVQAHYAARARSQ